MGIIRGLSAACCIATSCHVTMTPCLHRVPLRLTISFVLVSGRNQEFLCQFVKLSQLSHYRFPFSFSVFSFICSSECSAVGPPAVMSSLLMKVPVCPALFGLSQSSLCHPAHAHREQQSLVCSVCASCHAACMFVGENWATFASHVGDEHKARLTFCSICFLIII